MSEKSNRKTMILHKSGECLKYALGRELVEKSNPNIPSHLDAFVAYFILTGKIDRKTGTMISLVRYANEDETDYHELHEEISTLIIKELKKHFEFSSSDELFAVLDDIEIPDWAFDNGSLLIDMLPDVYLIKDKLYYIREKDGETLFMYGYPEHLDLEFEDDEGVVNEHDIISRLYSEIIGYDPVFSAIYLRLKNMTGIYSAYYVDYDQEGFKHGECIGVLGGGKLILIEDGYLVMEICGIKERIKPVNDCEQYTVKEDHILVKPVSTAPRLFRPYHLMPDGSIEKSTYPERKAYIIGLIEDDLRGHSGKDEMKELAIEYFDELALYFDNDEFTSDYLSGLIKAYGHTEKKIVRNYLHLCQILGNCISKDHDILTELYMLGDVSRKMTEDVGPDFISDALCRAVDKLYMGGEFGKSIKNTNDLYEKLLTNVYWTEERFKDRPQQASTTQNMKIGGFDFDGKKIQLEGVGTTDFIVLGNLILPRACNTPGMVSYNMEAGRYEVRYGRLLSDAQKAKIIESFSLEDERYKFYADIVFRRAS